MISVVTAWDSSRLVVPRTQLIHLHVISMFPEPRPTLTRRRLPRQGYAIVGQCPRSSSFRFTQRDFTLEPSLRAQSTAAELRIMRIELPSIGREGFTITKVLPLARVSERGKKKTPRSPHSLGNNNSLRVPHCIGGAHSASQHPEHEDDGHMKCDTVLHPKVLSLLPRGTSLTGTLVQ